MDDMMILHQVVNLFK